MKYKLLAILVLPLLFSCNNQEANSEESSEVENEKFNIGKLDRDATAYQFSNVVSQVKDSSYPNIHSVLIAKDGALVFEHYFSGMDENWGRDLGVVNHTDTTLHDVRSVSKSFVSACVGIAIEKGLIKGVDQNIAGFFPEFDTFFVGDKSAWTIYHFLTMTTGLRWNEQASFDSGENDEIVMTFSEEPIKYVFSKPLDTTPGKVFNYSGGATQVLAEIIQRTSNMPLAAFAEKHLFQPMEIEHFEWRKMKSGDHAGASGLRLRPESMLKFGVLYRNGGVWGGRRILTEKWVKESFTPRITFYNENVDDYDSYGYQFWMWTEKDMEEEVDMVSAIGNGGQLINWNLENDVIIVITAGNYNKHLENDSYALAREEIYPVLLNHK